MLLQRSGRFITSYVLQQFAKTFFTCVAAAAVRNQLLELRRQVRLLRRGGVKAWSLSKAQQHAASEHWVPADGRHEDGEARMCF